MPRTLPEEMQTLLTKECVRNNLSCINGCPNNTITPKLKQVPKKYDTKIKYDKKYDK